VYNYAANDNIFTDITFAVVVFLVDTVTFIMTDLVNIGKPLLSAAASNIGWIVLSGSYEFEYTAWNLQLGKYSLLMKRALIIVIGAKLQVVHFLRVFKVVTVNVTVG